MGMRTLKREVPDMPTPIPLPQRRTRPHPLAADLPQLIAMLEGLDDEVRRSLALGPASEDCPCGSRAESRRHRQPIPPRPIGSRSTG